MKFSAERIEEMRQIPLVDFCRKLGYTVEKHGIGKYRLAEHDSLVIYPNDNHFFRFSTGRGGDIFNLAYEIYGADFKTTYQTLTELYFQNEETMQQIKSTPRHYQISSKEREKKTIDTKKLFLEEGSFTVIHDYLHVERCIPKDILLEFYDLGLIRENKFGYVVFLGKEKDEIKYAFLKRGSKASNEDQENKKYLPFYEAPGSDKSVGFQYVEKSFYEMLKPNEDGYVENLEKIEIYVFEAAIDLMSYKAYHDKKKKMLEEVGLKNVLPPAAFISLNGLEPLSLNAFLEKHINNVYKEEALKKVNIVFCLDNDKPGEEKTQKYKEIYGIEKGFSVSEKNDLYKGYDDVNEWLSRDKNALEISKLKTWIIEKKKEIASNPHKQNYF